MNFYLSVEDVSHCLNFCHRDRCLASNHSHSPTIFVGFVVFFGKPFHPMHNHIPRKFVPGCVSKDYSRKRLENRIASKFNIRNRSTNMNSALISFIFENMFGFCLFFSKNALDGITQSVLPSILPALRLDESYFLFHQQIFRTFLVNLCIFLRLNFYLHPF